MGKDGEHRADCWKMPSRHLLNELFPQEVDVVDVVLARRGFLLETKMHRESFVNPAVSKDWVDTKAGRKRKQIRQQLPRQPAAVSVAATPWSLAPFRTLGSLGPLPFVH